MSPPPFRFPLALTLRASRRACRLLAAIHAIAALAFLQGSGSWPSRVAALAVLAASLLWSWRGERAKVGRTLVLHDDGRLGVAGLTDAPPAHPLPGCTDFGWAIWLQWQWQSDGERRAPWARGGNLMLLPDHLPPECWRALRVWLRHKVDAAGERRARGS